MFSIKVASWLALVILLICIGLITVQVKEFMDYRAEPSVWLKP